MSLPTGYGVGDYGGMIAAGPRIEAYVRALEGHVRPGSVVVDIGAGTGAFGLLACKLGAERVHVIEPNDAIFVAREAAAANGFADRMVFHQALSTEVKLGERADVVVSDLRGTLPLFERHIPAIVDARSRFLAPGGTLIPERDTIFAVPVEAPAIYRGYQDPWVSNQLGLDLSAGHGYAVSRWERLGPRAHIPLAEPAVWTELDYRHVEDPDVDATLAWPLSRTGTLHGFLLWFDCAMPAGAGFSNAPGLPELVYGQSFLPVSSSMDVGPGDTISLRLAATLVGGEYAWRWETRVTGRGGAVRADMKQSTLFAEILSPARLRKREAGFVPLLTPAGEADAFILSRMDGAATLEAISRAAAERFPTLFPRWEDALARAGELAERNT